MTDIVKIERDGLIKYETITEEYWWKMLADLASPLAETLSDGERITAFCKVAHQLLQSRA